VATASAVGASIATSVGAEDTAAPSADGPLVGGPVGAALAVSVANDDGTALAVSVAVGDGTALGAPVGVSNDRSTGAVDMAVGVGNDRSTGAVGVNSDRPAVGVAVGTTVGSAVSVAPVAASGALTDGAVAVDALPETSPGVLVALRPATDADTPVGATIGRLVFVGVAVSVGKAVGVAVGTRVSVGASVEIGVSVGVAVGTDREPTGAPTGATIAPTAVATGATIKAIGPVVGKTDGMSVGGATTVGGTIGAAVESPPSAPSSVAGRPGGTLVARAAGGATGVRFDGPEGAVPSGGDAGGKVATIGAVTETAIVTSRAPPNLAPAPSDGPDGVAATDGPIPTGVAGAVGGAVADETVCAVALAGPVPPTGVENGTAVAGVTGEGVLIGVATPPRVPTPWRKEASPAVGADVGTFRAVAVGATDNRGASAIRTGAL